MQARPLVAACYNCTPTQPPPPHTGPGPIDPVRPAASHPILKASLAQVKGRCRFYMSKEASEQSTTRVQTDLHLLFWCQE